MGIDPCGDARPGQAAPTPRRDAVSQHGFARGAVEERERTLCCQTCKHVSAGDCLLAGTKKKQRRKEKVPRPAAHRYWQNDWNWYTNSSTMSHSHRLGSSMFRLLFRMTAGGGEGGRRCGVEGGTRGRHAGRPHPPPPLQARGIGAPFRNEHAHLSPQGAGACCTPACTLGPPLAGDGLWQHDASFHACTTTSLPAAPTREELAVVLPGVDALLHGGLGAGVQVPARGSVRSGADFSVLPLQPPAPALQPAPTPALRPDMTIRSSIKPPQVPRRLHMLSSICRCPDACVQ